MDTKEKPTLAELEFCAKKYHNKFLEIANYWYYTDNLFYNDVVYPLVKKYGQNKDASFKNYSNEVNSKNSSIKIY